MKKLAATSALGLILLGAGAVALEEGPFTMAQATAGRALYAANCAACHGAQLRGAGEAPALMGSSFMAAWGSRSTEELYNLVKASMPYGNGNSLDAATYRNIVAYVLASNGAKAGAAALAGNRGDRRRQGFVAARCARRRRAGTRASGDILSAGALWRDRGGKPEIL